MSKVIKGTMSIFIAGSMMMNTAVFAASNDATTAPQATTTAPQATTTAPQVAQPKLVQGDFFYFVKTTIEQIRLALATNNLDKAQLLSEQAAERIAEANALNEKGKDTLTQDTLNKAADSIEQADKLSVETKEKPEEQAKKKDVEVHIGHNIESLAAVLDKVKNPKAKEAIAKNIEKSFTKLAARIEKVKEEQTVTTNQQTAGETQAAPATNTTTDQATSQAATDQATTQTTPAPALTVVGQENTDPKENEQGEDGQGAKKGNTKEQETHSANAATPVKVEAEREKKDKKVEKKQEHSENHKEND